VASLDILDNVIPYIGGEEDKLKIEPAKMLGRYQDGQVIPLPLKTSVSCNRVPVLDGHLVCVAVNFAHSPTQEEIIEAWDTYHIPEIAALPSAPALPVRYRREADRPQTRRDREEGQGMTTVIGRLRPCEVLEGVQFVALSHNTIRGAAGCSILNAELAVARGLVEKAQTSAQPQTA
jgi:aspartate-semialdehyde dehydrogenase